jgi:hypothetical protein
VDFLFAIITIRSFRRAAVIKQNAVNDSFLSPAMEIAK